MSRYEIHAHSEGSNLRLLDSINRPEALIQRALDLGLSGITLTDHEFVGNVPNFFKAYEEIAEEHPNFKVAAGNEIYLCESREKQEKYYHFILIAKNKIGWRALRELSTRAWLNSFQDGMERVVTTYSDIEEIMGKYPNSLIATTACLGGQLSYQTLNLIFAEKYEDKNGIEQAHSNIVKFVLWCKQIFGNDFYIECAPGCSKEQIMVNQRLLSIANCFDVKMVVGTDSHYLKKEDRYIHANHLNSKGGEREVDAFYEYAYLQTNEEIIENLKQSNYDELFVKKMFDNSQEIADKIEIYSIWHNQTIPKVKVKDYPKNAWWGNNNDWADEMNNYPTLKSMFTSDDIIDRYWVNQCWEGLQKKKGFWLDYLNYVERLEEEASTKKFISEKLNTNIFAYPITLQHYINLIWESGSMVGAGRGSSCAGLNHWLLGVTQLDPIKWEFPWFRYLNNERVELPDIDIDICPSKKGIILEKIRKERGAAFNKDIDELSRANLGCVMVATFGTETTKSAIQTACRGYRSKDFPEGIDVDTSLYLSSLVPIERGKLWPLKDVYYGNEEKGRKPVKYFVNEVDRYPGLYSIMEGIEGIVKQRSSHASGVILNDEDPYEFLAYMRTPKGEVITQFDLHVCEALGATKYDFLVTEVQEKLTESIKLLQEDNVIDRNLTLREAYDKYLHPDILPINDRKIWSVIQEASTLDLFQLDSDIGRQGAKKVRPTTIYEMSAVNGLIRLMPQDREEPPINKYIRFRNNPKLWEAEMNRYKLSHEEKMSVRKYLSRTFGIGISQEQLMLSLMDSNICDFSLAEANSARKIVAKKQQNKIAELKELVWQKAYSEGMAEYIWQAVVAPGLGYSFSDIHSMAYSFIGFQTAYIATRWNPIYWNTACLIVNSGSLEDSSEEELVSIYAPEGQDLAEGVTFTDLPDRSGKIRKTSSTDYGKVAKALGNIISNNIKVSLVDINKSAFSFKPDVENNEILFGLKGLTKVNDNTIEEIIKNRPYKNIKDFMNRCPLNKTTMISLIKAGAFDKIDKYWTKDINENSRMVTMAYYLKQASAPKSRITLQNLNGLIQKNLLPEEYSFEKSVFLLNKEFKSHKYSNYYIMSNEKVYNFYESNFDIDNVQIINNQYCISQAVWDKIYKQKIDRVRTWMTNNQQDILDSYNSILFKDIWDKYAKGNLSSWEMDSMCFYYHDHELKNIDTQKYGIVNFSDLNEEPIIEKIFNRGKNSYQIYKTSLIAGTVIGKTDNRSSITLLTTDGVVNVKFTKDQYAKFNRQISELQMDGTKKIAETGWFTRGTKLLLTGYRRNDTFNVKTYSHTPTHQVYKIKILENGKDIELEHERKGYEEYE